MDARCLWTFLGSKDEFAHWVKEQIARARLLEHRDFEVIGEIPKNPTGGRPRTNYILTIDAAKHIGMVSGTANLTP